jgi:hypothetical protein
MYTTDELICTCISRQIKDGEMVAQGIATPLVAAGYLLAKLHPRPQPHLCVGHWAGAVPRLGTAGRGHH